jgi:flavin-dependent dehydrogenase
MTRHDVVVIGGSLAGAACVRELERLGLDAVAFERDRFPRAKVCGGFLSPGAVQSLTHLGLLNDVLEAGAVEVTSARVKVRNAEVEIPFERPGLGVTRSTLDEIFARGARVLEGRRVQDVRESNDGFIVDGVRCAVVIDASGKLGRFTKRRSVEEFGVQYVEPRPRTSVLEFSFFEDGYGGGVSVEGECANFCFLVRKDSVARYASRPGCLVTGPLAYDKLPGRFISIGDAAGMVDPFCGEGMRHAMESGVMAARVVAAGFRRGAAYEEMKQEYESEWRRRWAFKRAATAGIRRLLRHPSLFSMAIRMRADWILNRLWN